jgi:hypothetical protein
VITKSHISLSLSLHVTISMLPTVGAHLTTARVSRLGRSQQIAQCTVLYLLESTDGHACSAVMLATIRSRSFCLVEVNIWTEER